VEADRRNRVGGLTFPPMPPRVIPASVTQRVNDIKDLIDDLVRLRHCDDPFAVEMSSHIKQKVDALVRSVNGFRTNRPNRSSGVKCE